MKISLLGLENNDDAFSEASSFRYILPCWGVIGAPTMPACTTCRGMGLFRDCDGYLPRNTVYLIGCSYGDGLSDHYDIELGIGFYMDDDSHP